MKPSLESLLPKVLKDLYANPDRGVVSGGPEYEKSCGNSGMNSEMAGPIAMKLLGSAHVFGQKKLEVG